MTLGYDAGTLVREKEGTIGSIDDLRPGESAMFFSQNGLPKLVRCIRER